MASRAREAVAPAYLFLCLVAGGSAQGLWANMLLQLLGVAIIAWAAMSGGSQPAPPARGLFLIVIAALVLIAIQLVPLPASVWPHLGGREGIASGYKVLGIATPPLPISLGPYDSLQALLTLVPPVAMLCAMLRLHAYRPSWLALALLGGTFCGILLGVLQVASGDPLTSSWYRGSARPTRPSPASLSIMLFPTCHSPGKSCGSIPPMTPADSACCLQAIMGETFSSSRLEPTNSSNCPWPGRRIINSSFSARSFAATFRNPAPPAGMLSQGLSPLSPRPRLVFRITRCEPRLAPPNRATNHCRCCNPASLRSMEASRSTVNRIHRSPTSTKILAGTLKDNFWAFYRAKAGNYSYARPFGFPASG